MAPLPSALRGNLAASAEQVLHRPPMFEKHFKSSRNIQYKQLQVERKFSHYEQKIFSAPIDRCNTKMPRRLQTSKVTQRIPNSRIDEERIKWNERLAAWLQEDKTPSLEYIKISDQCTPIEKQLYYCSACHEFFHLNLKERTKRIACPRFKHHGEDHVRPVTIKTSKRRISKRPPLVAQDPFGNRQNLNIPSLQPPKLFKRQPMKVVVDVPRLPSLTKTTASEKTVSPRTISRKGDKSPGRSSEDIENTKPIERKPSPVILPNIFQSPAAYSMPETESPEYTPVLELEISEEPIITEQSEKPEIDITPIEVSPDTDIELDIRSPSITSQQERQESKSPPAVRPRPPPPDLPTFRMKESPEFQDFGKKAKPRIQRRQAMLLPTSKPEPKPKLKEKAPKTKRMSKEEMTKRMQRAKAIDGYRKRYEFGTEEWTTTDDDESSVASDADIYDDSFLEKYCLVDPNHLEYCKKRFHKYDKDKDGYLTSEEVVNLIHKMFSPRVLDDVHMCYIFRILETTSYDVFTDKMNLKLFAIVTALAKKISQLDNHMKYLIGRVNIEVVDWKLCRARQLFEQTMRRNAQGNYRVPMESLWLELHAGGISEEHENQARRTLAHMKEMDLMDFLTYLPLFLLVHSQVVKNPLNSDRHI
uniref:uncharacterized protein LOC120346203 isoform X3 n=1 Tax=Styela clava TaxID=7725 RepID=UPI00193AA4DE|nr:uncharacterized protein LOC120346203 isoform X3 [Styela clava]